MQLSLALVLTAVVAALGAEANVLQAGSCAMTCKGPKTAFCSGVGALPTALVSTAYNNECECLQDKCVKGKAVQCYAKPTTGKCNATALAKLNEPSAKSLKFVCGSNGVTYDNYFHLKVARVLNENIQFLQTAKCTPKYKTCMPKVKCSNEDKVVCAIETKGAKAVNFRNQCYFTIGKCLNPGLTAVTADKCPLRKSKPKPLSADNAFGLVATNATKPTPTPTPLTDDEDDDDDDAQHEGSGPDDVWDATDLYIGEDLSVDEEMPETTNGTTTTMPTVTATPTKSTAASTIAPPTTALSSATAAVSSLGALVLGAFVLA